MQNEQITYVSSKRKWFNFNIAELWRYRDLAVLFVKRNLKVSYKQTILGPIWIIINPLLSTSVFTIIFSVIAGISTDGMPPFLFYMAGNVLWNFFSSCLNKGSGTFLSNARVFGKVYFPRLISPISDTIFNMVNYLIQMILFVGLVIFYGITNPAVQPNLYLLLVPVMILQTAVLGTGCGLIISSITTKYRDLNILVSFGVSLWMYITPVVYPASRIPGWLHTLFMLNPMAPIIECYRYAFLGSGTFDMLFWLISVAVTLLIFGFGLIVFNRVEKNFIDTV